MACYDEKCGNELADATEALVDALLDEAEERRKRTRAADNDSVSFGSSYGMPTISAVDQAKLRVVEAVKSILSQARTQTRMR